MVNNTKKILLSTSEAAKVLGISRIAVFKKIKNGQLRAEKIAGRYVIDPDLLGISYKKLDAADKRRIRLAVTKVLKEYGDVIKKLGDE